MVVSLPVATSVVTIELPFLMDEPNTVAATSLPSGDQVDALMAPDRRSVEARAK